MRSCQLCYLRRVPPPIILSSSPLPCFPTTCTILARFSKMRRAWYLVRMAMVQPLAPLQARRRRSLASPRQSWTQTARARSPHPRSSSQASQPAGRR